MSNNIGKKIRSPRKTLGGYVILPRLIDKVRLHAKGELPPEYVDNLLRSGTFLDHRFIQFTGLNHEKMREAILASETDDEVLDWVKKMAFNILRKKGKIGFNRFTPPGLRPKE